MRFGEIVLVLCGALWFIHALQLVRLPLSKSWQALAIAGFGVSATLVCWWLWPARAWLVAAALVAMLLVLPALSTRAASRALRWGHIRRARVYAALAQALRPIEAQRRFRRAVEVSWQLARGDAVDVEAALASIEADEVERRAHRLAFLSWTNDFEAMARELDSEPVRRFAMRAGMAAIVTTVVGETGSEAELSAHYRRLQALPSMARRNLDGSWALVAMAAYLGAPELVEEQIDDLRFDLPPDRIAFVRATAYQRAGDPARAQAIVDEALAAPGLSHSAQRRLAYRRERVLPPAPDGLPRRDMRDDVSQKLRARRVLGALGLGVRRPSPLTWSIAAALCAVYAWQWGQPQAGVFRSWGLLSPWSEAPDPWRLWSYAFLHLDAGHLAVNLVGLLLFGRFVERHQGARRMLLIYLVGALAGGVAYLWFARGFGVAIGASGAVLALFGATGVRIAADPVLRHSPQGRRELALLGGVALLQLAVDALWAQSSGSAHGGGMLAGALIGGGLWVWDARAARARRS